MQGSLQRSSQRHLVLLIAALSMAGCHLITPFDPNELTPRDSGPDGDGDGWRPIMGIPWIRCAAVRLARSTTSGAFGLHPMQKSSSRAVAGRFLKRLSDHSDGA